MNYENIKAEAEVLGNIYNNPKLLGDPSYFFNEEDFTDELHKVLFATMYTLYENGVTEFQIKDIENFLENKVRNKITYESNKGRDLIIDLSSKVSLSSFNYYYQRLRKFSILRGYAIKLGMDLSWIYDCNNIVDLKKIEAQDKALDEMTISELDKMITDKIENVRMQSLVEDFDDCVKAGKGIRELVKKFLETPNVGLSLYGKIRNAIHAGARLGKFYLRSAGGGIGKTRTMIADACVLGFEGYFEESGEFVYTGDPQHVEYIIVEQEIEEVQSLILSFVSGIDQTKIEEKQNELTKEEQDRLEKALEIIENGELHIQYLHEYNMLDLKETIRKGVFKRDVVYFFFDYIENNIKILEELQRRAGGKIGLREDQILFIITNGLKDLAVQYKIFIESATQLNGNWGDEHMDSRMLAGGKAMDRKIDYGEIMLRVTPQDIEKLKPILQVGLMQIPEIKIGVYKNRGKKFDDGIIWCANNKGICRIEPLFVTDYNYKLIEFKEDYNVIAVKEEGSKEKTIIEKEVIEKPFSNCKLSVQNSEEKLIPVEVKGVKEDEDLVKLEEETSSFSNMLVW